MTKSTVPRRCREHFEKIDLVTPRELTVGISYSKKFGFSESKLLQLNEQNYFNYLKKKAILI